MTKGQIARYVLLPGIWPRLRHLTLGGVLNVALLLAYVFASVRLLPPTHPYLNPANQGRFGIRAVLAEAGSHLRFTRRHADQVFVYLVILAGIVLFCIQFLLLIAAIASQPVLAQMTGEQILNPAVHQGTYSPSQDIAFILLDKIFGVGGIFNSCISVAGAQCLDVFGNPTSKPASFPYPMHKGLHELLGFYSMGIGIISLMVIIYQITTVAGETAATGTPFGRRYNRAWAPVRMIMFFALLAPLNIGSGDGRAWLNGAQLITLWTAKWGSDVATSGWFYYINNLKTTYIGQVDELIAEPNLPSVSYMLRFYMLVHSCERAYEATTAFTGERIDVDAYLIRSGDVGAGGFASNSLPKTTSFDDALKFNNNGNITVRFGSREVSADGVANTNESLYRGGVNPVCGDITLNVGDITQPGARKVMENYYNMMLGFYNRDLDSTYSFSMADTIIYFANCHVHRSKADIPVDAPCSKEVNVNEVATGFAGFVRDVHSDLMKEAMAEQTKNDKLFDLPEEIKQKGWAGAALWYNTIAQMNGAVTAAVINSPTVTRYPEIMHRVEAANLQRSENANVTERFDPGGLGDGNIDFARGEDLEIARMLNGAYKIFDNNNIDETPQTRKSGNIVIDSINMLFGTSGLYDLRYNDQKNINPLAQLSSLGRAMVEQAIRNFASAIGASLGNGLLGLITGKDVPALEHLNNFLETVGSIGILTGFILYYVLPFLPFLYFFFAMGEWAKSIFEAIVAMPLWALAHLTIDGNGLPGQAAANGYYLLLGIFIRPILIFLGLIGSVTAFSTMVQVLNGIFDIVVVNVSGADQFSPAATPSDIEYYRAPLDEFVFTVLYAVLCYMIGLSCFKMIDTIPMTILRWMGVGVETYQQLAGNKTPLDQMTGTVYSSGALTLGKVQQGLGHAGMSGQTALILAR